MSGNPFAHSVVHLDEAQLDTVLSALDEAADCRYDRYLTECAECLRLDPGLCADHATDNELAGRYADVARQLRQEAAR